jgi:acetylornithine deacetylase
MPAVMTIDPILLARELIDVPSPTGDESAVGGVIDARLTALGFETRRYPVTESRFNLLATAGGRPRIVLCSHIDTVPPWFASRDEGDYLFGRGACDTKGIIAAMIAAGERLRRSGVLDFAFLFVVGEETDSVGAKQANRDLEALGSEFVVVGEPTESKYARASKGALTAFVRFDGVAAHSAYPERGDSAILKMTRAINEINHAEWGYDNVLGVATANVGVVRGGEKPNIIPARAELEMIIRTVGHPDEVRARLEEIVGRHHGHITEHRGNPPMFMLVPEGEPSHVVAFNTDVPHLGNLGQPLLFGPGSILDAHGASEKIRKDDLVASIATYERLVRSLLTAPKGVS